MIILFIVTLLAMASIVARIFDLSIFTSSFVLILITASYLYCIWLTFTITTKIYYLIQLIPRFKIIIGDVKARNAIILYILKTIVLVFLSLFIIMRIMDAINAWDLYFFSILIGSIVGSIWAKDNCNWQDFDYDVAPYSKLLIISIIIAWLG